MNYAIMLFISIFILNENVRNIMFPYIGMDKYYNIFSIIIILLIIILKKKRTSKYYRNIALCFLGWVIFLNILNKLSIGYYLNPLINYIIPILILSFDNLIESKQQYIKIVKIFNALIYVITIFGIVDYISGYKLNSLLKSFILDSNLRYLMTYMSSHGSYRLYTIFGHPLVNSQYYLFYFFLNWGAIKWFGYNINMLKVAIIYIIGILLCGSKMALFISIVIVIFYASKNKNLYLKLSYFCFIIATCILLITTPFFKENVVVRIQRSIESGDITNGRIGALEKVGNTVGLELPILLGGGYDYSREITNSAKTNNFEMPFIMFWYDYGLIAMIILYYTCFAKPIFVHIKNKDKATAFLLFLIVLYLNSFNGLMYGDNFARLIFILKISNDAIRLRSNNGMTLEENM